MIAIITFLLKLVLSTKECTYTSNRISITDDSSLEDIKDDLRPIFLRLTSPGCPYSPASDAQWAKASELYPQVDFVTVDCWKNGKICSLFGDSLQTPYHAFVPAGSTQYVEDSTFGNNNEISQSPQLFIKIIQKYSDLYPVSSPIISLFPVVTDSFYQNVENPIFLLYNSKCSDEVPFLNAWTKIANEEIIPEDDYPRIGMLDCSKYFDECQRWIRPYAPKTPVALIYSSKTGNFEVLESYNNLNSDKVYSLYSNAYSKPQKPMPTPIPVPDDSSVAPSDEGYTLIQNTELFGRTVNTIKPKYVESYVHPSSACATPSECSTRTLNVPSQCPEIKPSTDDHTKSLKIINFLRELAGLPSNVIEDSNWSDLCYSTAINLHKIGKVPSNHVIKNEYAMPGYCGKTENIQTAKDSLLSENTNSVFVSAYKLIKDEGAHNDLDVGHRRWLLHPDLKKIGIGYYPYKEDDFGTFHMMRVAATVIKVCEKGMIAGSTGALPSNLNFISWPPQGPFPIDHLPSNWHISHPDFRKATLNDFKIYISRDDGAELKVLKAALNSNVGFTALVIKMTSEALQLCQPMRTITVSAYNVISKKLYRFSFELFNTADLQEICFYSTDSSKCPSTVTQANRFGPGNYQTTILSSASGNVKVHVVDQIKLTQPLKITSAARFFICGDGEIEGEIQINKQTIADVQKPSKIDFTTTWSVSSKKIGRIETAYKAKSISITVTDSTESISIHDLTFYTGNQASCKLTSTLFRGMTYDIYYTIGGTKPNYYVSVSPVPAFQAYSTALDETIDAIQLNSLFDMEHMRTNKRIIKIYASSMSNTEPINLSCFIPNCKKDYQFYMFGGKAYFLCDLNISKVANSILFDSNKIYGTTQKYDFQVYKFDADDSRDICPMNFVTINSATFSTTAVSMPYVRGDNTAKASYNPSINFDIFPEVGAPDSSTINAYLDEDTSKHKAIVTTNGKYDSYRINLYLMDKTKYNPLIIRPAEGTESKQVTITFKSVDFGDSFVVPDSPTSFRTYFENFQDLILDLPTVQKHSSSPGGKRSLLSAYHFDNCTKVRFTKSSYDEGKPIEVTHNITLGNIDYGFTVLTNSVKVDNTDSYDASKIQTKELNVIGKTTPTIKQMTIKEKINIDSATLILENCQLENQIKLNMQRSSVWPSISLFETEFEPESISIDLGFTSSSKLLNNDANEEYESHSLITGIKNTENKCESIKNLAQVSNKGVFEIECSSDKTELVAVKGKSNAPVLLPEDSVTPIPTPGEDEESNILLCNEAICDLKTGDLASYTIRVNVQQSNPPAITIKPADGKRSTPISIQFVDALGTHTTIPNKDAKFVANFENFDDLTIDNPVLYEGTNLLDCYKFISCGKVSFTNQPQDNEIQNNDELLFDGSASEINYGVPVSYPSCHISNTGSYVARNIQAEKLSVDPSLTTTISEIKISKGIEVKSSKVTLKNCELSNNIEVSISKSNDEWPLIELSNTPFSPASITVDLQISSSNLNNLLENERNTILSGLTSCDSIISKTTLVNGGQYQLVCSDDQTSLNVEKSGKPDEKPVEKPTDEKPVEKPTDEKPVEKPTDEKPTDAQPGETPTPKPKGGIPLAAIIGGAVGVIAIIAIIIVVLVIVKKRKAAYQKSSENENEIRELQNIEKEETKAQDI